MFRHLTSRYTLAVQDQLRTARCAGIRKDIGMTCEVDGVFFRTAPPPSPRPSASAIRWRSAPVRVRLQRSGGGHGGSRRRDPRDQDQPRSNPSGRPVGVGTTSTGGAPWGAGETYTVQRNDPAFVSNNAAQEVAVSGLDEVGLSALIATSPSRQRSIFGHACDNIVLPANIPARPEWDAVRNIKGEEAQTWTRVAAARWG